MPAPKGHPTTRPRPAAAAGSGAKAEAPEKVIATNPTAGHLYHLLDRYEAGVALLGTEVKAAREGKVNLKEGFVAVRDMQAWLHGCHIGAYSNQGYASHDPLRARRLLLHKQELRKLYGKIQIRGYTLVPTRLYVRRGRLKLELALAEGKKLHDKREAIKKRETDRDVRRQMKER